MEEHILAAFILVLMESGTKSHKEFDDLKKIKQKFYCSDYFDASVNKYGVKCGISLTFCEDNGLVNSKDSYGSFQWYFRYWLGRKLKDDERQINRWKRIVSRFKSKLVKMIKMLVVNLMIVHSRLKLDTFYCIGVMN